MINDEQYALLKEAYYGKPKEFELAENSVKKIIQMIKEERSSKTGKLDDKTISTSDELTTLERLFTKALKMQAVHIVFYSNPNSMYANNAYTITGYFLSDRDKKGMRAKSDKLTAYVYVDKGLIYNNKLNEKEVMSLILHEIGHNFDRSIFSLISTPIIALLIFNLPVLKQIFQLGLGINNLVTKGITYLTEKIPYLGKISNFINDTIVGFNKLVIGVNPLMNIYAIIINMTNYPNSFFTYSKEKYADSFAASYGYATDLATAFNKMKLLSNNYITDMYDVPVANTILLTNLTGTYALLSLMDPHPDDTVRIKSMLNKLKRDASSNDLPPELKKELNANIKEMEAFLKNEYLNPNKKYNKDNPLGMLIKKAVFEKNAENIDVRELLEKIWRHEE